MNKVVHFEVPFKDKERAKKFYSEIFGWKIISMPYNGGEYIMAQTAKTDEKGMIQDDPGSINGGMVPKDDSAPATVLVLDVENVDEKVKEVEKAGGKVIMPKTKVMEMGLYAKVKDTEGNVIGLWENIK